MLRVFCFSIQFSNISSDLRYRNHHKINRSIGQSTLTERSSYFHICWLWHFPKVKHYPISGLVNEESTHGNAVHNQSQARCLMGKLPIARHVQRKVPDLYAHLAPTPTGCCRTAAAGVTPGLSGAHIYPHGAASHARGLPSRSVCPPTPCSVCPPTPCSVCPPTPSGLTVAVNLPHRGKDTHGAYL